MNKLLLVLGALTVGSCTGLNIERAKADLAAGGRKVCPYCGYCVYRRYCPCSSYAECDLCVYEPYCDSTCQALCKTPDPCQTKSCSVNETCVEKSPGEAVCVCKTGHVCDEDPQCVNKGKNGSCDFYSCFDQRTNCGEQGYALNYGHKYCTRFSQYKDQFTSDGQNMIDCVRKCLTNALLAPYRSNNQAGLPQVCQDIQNTAFNSHVKCYYDCNFCDVWSHNKLALNTVYQYKDFFSRQALKQVKDVAVKCTADTYQEIKEWVSNTFSGVTDIFG